MFPTFSKYSRQYLLGPGLPGPWVLVWDCFEVGIK